jgi:hypothetical protein
LFIKLFAIGIDLLMNVFEKIRQLFLRKISGFTIDRFEFAAVNGDKFLPKEVQSLAEDGKCSADALQRLRILFANSSDRFKGGGELVQQPPQLELALAFVLELAT